MEMEMGKGNGGSEPGDCENIKVITMYYKLPAFHLE